MTRIINHEDKLSEEERYILRLAHPLWEYCKTAYVGQHLDAITLYAYGNKAYTRIDTSKVREDDLIWENEK